jgi:hypothetical protein
MARSSTARIERAEAPPTSSRSDGDQVTDSLLAIARPMDIDAALFGERSMLIVTRAATPPARVVPTAGSPALHRLHPPATHDHKSRSGDRDDDRTVTICVLGYLDLREAVASRAVRPKRVRSNHLRQSPGDFESELSEVSGLRSRIGSIKSGSIPLTKSLAERRRC